uniref:DNA polymerase subunit gamma-1 n=1 Tax=Clytia hemisphaerica TaxID=252671 RepID=A0A7M5UUB8_9CNID
MNHGSTNSLAKLYEFYCHKTLDKSTRDLFVEGNLQDIRESFQCVRNYCALDVKSTFEIYQMMWPDFLVHVPSPVSFCGMLEMGTSFLPITRSWKEYIQRSEEMFEKITSELKESLMDVAEDTLKLMIDDRYKENLWTWNMNWSIHKTARPPADFVQNNTPQKNVLQTIAERIDHLSDKRKTQLHMSGYPKWYRELCVKTKKDESVGNEEQRKPVRPVNISSQKQVTPYLLQMTWDGYPLHYEQKHGWGFLAPMKTQMHHLKTNVLEKEKKTGFPYRVFMEFIKQRKEDREEDLAKLQLFSQCDDMNGIDIGLPCIRFFKLPHKNGDNFNVGNPLAKDFLSKIEDGTLATSGNFNAKLPIELNKMLSFWRNGRKRICTQMAIWLDDNEKDAAGVILPQIITAGTVTRRAVEPTWLTASNPLRDRIGSELKSMVRPPPGYSLVGADVDCQELWIASVLGDAQFAQIHGCTASSWMTLQGKKSEQTDLHSKTADTIGMSRDQAKIFNYGRVYGAGESFAVRLLMQFNHNLTQREAENTAAKLYESTKGIKRYRLNGRGKTLAEELEIMLDFNDLVSYVSLKRLLQEHGLSWSKRAQLVDPQHVWFDESESDMFNKLESIALSEQPRTPVLNCLITKALFPKHVENHYKTSRVNWVVQSSAVDYLHLMLTSMAWLIKEYNIDARFCVSIHDEVRYIVKDKDRYRLALALQITNLLTRSMFAYKLNLNDLPQFSRH